MGATVALDILVVLMFIIGIIYGYKRGFIMVLLGTLRKPTTVILSLLLARPVGALIGEKWFLSSIAEKMAGWLNMQVDSTLSGQTAVDHMEAQTPAVIRLIAELLGYDTQKMAEEAVNSGKTPTEVFTMKLAEPVAQFIGMIIAFIVLLIVLHFLLTLVAKCLNGLCDIGPVRWVNRILGIVLGLFFLVCYAWIFCRVLVFVFSRGFLDDVAFFADFDIDRTWIARWIYHFNPLAFIFSFK